MTQSDFHVDKLAYAVSLLRGAQRLALTAKDEPIETIGIPFFLLVGFSIENGLKALLQFQQAEGKWQKSHDLAYLLSLTTDLEKQLWPGGADMLKHLSRYHKEYWFRYPERASTADVYSTTSTLFMVDNVLAVVARMVHYRA